MVFWFFFLKKVKQKLGAQRRADTSLPHCPTPPKASGSEAGGREEKFLEGADLRATGEEEAGFP